MKNTEQKINEQSPKSGKGSHNHFLQKDKNYNVAVIKYRSARLVVSKKTQIDVDT